MKAKWTMAAALGLALAVLGGCCQPAQQSQSLRAQAVASLGSSAMLFGPTPLALGLEDRGYFATTVVEEEPLLLFDERHGYVRTDIWDLEDDLQPNISHHRMQRHAVDVVPANR